MTIISGIDGLPYLFNDTNEVDMTSLLDMVFPIAQNEGLWNSNVEMDEI